MDLDGLPRLHTLSSCLRIVSDQATTSFGCWRERLKETRQSPSRSYLVYLRSRTVVWRASGRRCGLEAFTCKLDVACVVEVKQESSEVSPWSLVASSCQFVFGSLSCSGSRMLGICWDAADTSPANLGISTLPRTVSGRVNLL